jgi:hypothetical protein
MGSIGFIGDIGFIGFIVVRLVRAVDPSEGAARHGFELHNRNIDGRGLTGRTFVRADSATGGTFATAVKFNSNWKSSLCHT